MNTETNATPERRYWTLACRKRTANRFVRISDWSGTWHEAVNLAGAMIALRPELQVYYTTTAEAEANGYVTPEDCGNILTDAGKRIRMIDGGTLPDELRDYRPCGNCVSGRLPNEYGVSGPNAGSDCPLCEGGRIVDAPEAVTPEDDAPCRHSWVAGMMHVADEDLDTVAAMRDVTCERCEAVYVTPEYREFLVAVAIAAVTPEDDAPEDESDDMPLADKIEALSRVFGPEAIRWVDSEYVAELRERGYVHWNDRDTRETDGCVPHIDLSKVGKDECAYGQSSTLDRSNFRSLTRDYPGVFCPISYVNVDVLGAFIDDLSEDIIRTLCGLSDDYPVYDESDMSEIESEEITDSIRRYALWDLGKTIAETHGEAIEDEWDSLSEDRQAELLDTVCRENDYYPEHSGYEVSWDLPTIAGWVADHLAVTPLTAAA